MKIVSKGFPQCTVADDGRRWRGFYQPGDLMCVPHEDGYILAFYDKAQNTVAYGDVVRTTPQDSLLVPFHLIGPEAMKHADKWYPSTKAIHDLLRPYLRAPDEVVTA